MHLPSRLEELPPLARLLATRGLDADDDYGEEQTAESGPTAAPEATLQAERIATDISSDEDSSITAQVPFPALSTQHPVPTQHPAPTQNNGKLCHQQRGVESLRLVRPCPPGLAPDLQTKGHLHQALHSRACADEISDQLDNLFAVPLADETSGVSSLGGQAANPELRSLVEQV
jgi:hypothetical protein